MKPLVLVGRIQSVAPAPALQGVGAVHVQVADGAALLDLGDPRARVWRDLLEELREAGEPVYLEVDPQSRVIGRLLYPRRATVLEVAPAPEEGRHEVELEISQARHFLDPGNADYARLLHALQEACRQGHLVLVTETPDEHEIVDVRVDSGPFDAGLAGAPGLAGAASEVTPEVAREWFARLARQEHIPFGYPDDGCWGRAHEMCRIMAAEGVAAGKVWIYGRLSVETANHPFCKVSWGWHVAPTLGVLGAEVHVLDPSIFPVPVTRLSWVEGMGDPHAAVHETEASVFYRGRTGRTSQDPDYTRTEGVLARYRRQLALRVAEHGAPPYDYCGESPATAWKASSTRSTGWR